MQDMPKESMCSSNMVVRGDFIGSESHELEVEVSQDAQCIERRVKLQQLKASGRKAIASAPTTLSYHFNMILLMAAPQTTAQSKS